MSEITTILALVVAFTMIVWWKFMRDGDLFSSHTTFGMIGFVIGAYISYRTFGLVQTDVMSLLFFIMLPVASFIACESVMSMLTFRSRSVRTLSLSNIEERTKKMQEMGVEKMLKKLKAQPLHVSLRGNSLYIIDSLVPNYELKYLVYTDPSSPKKIYGCFVPSDFDNADEAMAWKFQLTKEEYAGLEVEA